MKKIILALLAVGTMATTASAQKGSWFLYGNVGFSTGKDSVSTTTTSFTVAPGVGYQFKENWAVGIAVNYNQTGYKFDGVDGTTTQHNYQAGAFLRYTHPIAGIFSWFAQLDAFYMGGNVTPADGGEAVDKHSGFGVTVTPTVSAAIGNNWALNFSLGSLGFKSDKYDAFDNASNAFMFNFGQGAMFGIQKNFGCMHHRTHHEPGDEMHKMDTSDDNGDDDAPKHHHKHKKDKDNDD